LGNSRQLWVGHMHKSLQWQQQETSKVIVAKISDQCSMWQTMWSRVCMRVTACKAEVHYGKATANV